LGLAVGTGAGGAVARNRMRRRLRAIFRGAPIRPADVVVRADRAAMAASFQELETHLLGALTSTGVVTS
jgi:ribonuclease P protein component